MSRQFIISANSLTDGRVVYLDGNGGWTGDEAQALIVVEGAGYEAMLKRAGRSEADNLVLSVEPIEVAIEADCRDAQIAARKLRDTIRMRGPSIFMPDTGMSNRRAVEDTGAIDPAI
ncbi:MAG: DUF2849 domain-containing protein [Hyphomicrobiales bacterium]|nr:DUF2849 domain-containing protein [Hyphomicrobiales bacterium]